VGAAPPATIIFRVTSSRVQPDSEPSGTRFEAQLPPFVERVAAADVNFRSLEALDPRRCGSDVKLLRYVNSGAVRPAGDIQSIAQAMRVVGSEQLRRWVALAALPMLATEPSGRNWRRLSIVRPRFLRAIDATGGHSSGNEAFLIGMFLGVGRAARPAAGGSAPVG